MDQSVVRETASADTSVLVREIPRNSEKSPHSPKSRHTLQKFERQKKRGKKVGGGNFGLRFQNSEN